MVGSQGCLHFLTAPKSDNPKQAQTRRFGSNMPLFLTNYQTFTPKMHNARLTLYAEFVNPVSNNPYYIDFNRIVLLLNIPSLDARY